MFEHIQIRTDMKIHDICLTAYIWRYLRVILRVRYMFGVHGISKDYLFSLNCENEVFQKFDGRHKISIKSKVADMMPCHHQESSIRNQMIRIILFDHYRTEKSYEIKTWLIKNPNRNWFRIQSELKTISYKQLKQAIVPTFSSALIVELKV